MLQGGVVQIPLFTLQLGDDLINLVLYLFLILYGLQTFQQLIKGRSGIGHNRFHGIDLFQRIIDTDRVMDLKVGLLDFGTQTGCTTQHLLKENTGLDPAHEDQSIDLRYVNTGGQQVNSDNHAGIVLILETLDGFLDLLRIAATSLAGDLHNGIAIHTGFCIDVLQNVHDHIRMVIVDSEDQCLAGFLGVLGINASRDFLQHCLIEGTGDDLTVKLLHIEVQFIF